MTKVLTFCFFLINAIVHCRWGGAWYVASSDIFLPVKNRLVDLPRRFLFRPENNQVKETKSTYKSPVALTEISKVFSNWGYNFKQQNFEFLSSIHLNLLIKLWIWTCAPSDYASFVTVEQKLIF